MSNYYDEWHKRTYIQRVNAGLCVTCGNQPPVPQGKTCLDCREKVRLRRSRLTEEQKLRYNETSDIWKTENAEKISQRDKRYRDKLRTEVFQHYGGKCSCCREEREEFLTLDHINGGGNVERREIFNGHSRAGNPFYRMLRSRGFPPGFQVLCWNCHMSKTHYGFCPHNRN